MALSPGVSRYIQRSSAGPEGLSRGSTGRHLMSPALRLVGLPITFPNRLFTLDHPPRIPAILSISSINKHPSRVSQLAISSWTRLILPTVWSSASFPLTPCQPIPVPALPGPNTPRPLATGTPRTTLHGSTRSLRPRHQRRRRLRLVPAVEQRQPLQRNLAPRLPRPRPAWRQLSARPPSKVILLSSSSRRVSRRSRRILSSLRRVIGPLSQPALYIIASAML